MPAANENNSNGENGMFKLMRWMLYMMSFMITVGMFVFFIVLTYTFLSMVPNTLYELLVEVPKNVSTYYFDKLVGKQKFVFRQEEVLVKPIVPYNPNIRITWTPYSEKFSPRPIMNITQFEAYLREGTQKWSTVILGTGLWICQNVYTTLIATMVIIMFYMMIRSLRKVAFNKYKQVAYAFRGIKRYTGEAIMEGSSFVQGKIPGCQVEVCSVTAWTTTFIGYGVRIQDTLVVPAHVVNSVAADGGDFMIRTKKGQLLLEPLEYEQSHCLEDIVYVRIAPDRWSDLGVMKPALPNDCEQVRVDCTGQRGTSNGKLDYVNFFGFWKYSGSTVPGMSGAAYMTGNVCHGIHTGVAGGINIGAMSVAIDEELKQLCYPESQPPVKQKVITMKPEAKKFNIKTKKVYNDSRNASELATAFYKKFKQQTREHLARSIEKIREDPDAWANQDSDDEDYPRKGESYDLDTDIVERTLGLSQDQLRLLIPILQQRVMQPLPSTSTQVTGQAAEPQVFEIKEIPLESRVAMLESRMDKVEDFLEEMPGKLSSGQKRFLECDFPNCRRMLDGRKVDGGRKFKSADALLAHKIACNHMTKEKVPPEVKKMPEINIKSAMKKVNESLHSENEIKNQLGFRSPMEQISKKSPATKNSQSSVSTSNVEESTVVSTSTPPSPLSTQDILKQMQLSLELLAKTLSGQSSAATQN